MDKFCLIAGLIIGALGSRNHYFKQEKKRVLGLLILFHGLMYGGIGYFLYEQSIKRMTLCLFVSASIALSTIDYRRMILPSSMIYFFTGGVFIIKSVEVYKRGSFYPFYQSFLGAGVGYLISLFLFYSTLLIFKKEGIGYGDVRYCAFLGLLIPPEEFVKMLFIASMIGLIQGLFLLVKEKESKYFPFGMSLSLGAAVVLMWKEVFLQFI